VTSTDDGYGTCTIPHSQGELNENNRKSSQFASDVIRFKVTYI